MKSRLLHRSRHTLFAASLAAIFFASQSSFAASADLPKRKVGLWEIDMQIDGMPNLGPIQQCIDAKTDNLLAQKGQGNCSAMDIKTTGNRVAIHMVCKMDDSTATTNGAFEGSFDSVYTGSTTTRFAPPFRGMSESKMRQKARWLGPCKPGQKPGDVIMPGMGGINLNQLLNDPKMKELMKRPK